MSKLPRIKFKDKKDYQVPNTDEEFLIRAKDMNELKNTFNESAVAIEGAVGDVETAYSNMGDYKVENGLVYFKKADGTWNETGVSLAGQSTVLLDNVVLENVKLSTTRTVPTVENTVHVQVKDTSGKIVMIESTTDDVYLGANSKLTDVFVLFKQFINICDLFTENPVTILNALNQVLPDK